MKKAELVGKELLTRNEVYEMLNDIAADDNVDEYAKGWYACAIQALAELDNIKTVAKLDKKDGGGYQMRLL